MDAFDFAPDPDEKPKRTFRDVIFKLGGYYFIAATLCIIGYFVMIYLDPQSDLNPFKPPQQAGQEDKAVPTATETTTDPTATVNASETALPTATFTLTPKPFTLTPTITATLEPYPTATEVVLTTGTPAPTSAVLKHFAAQTGTPDYLSYSGGCNGLYIAGYVIDIDKQPLALMKVRVTGTLGGEEISEEALSGSNTMYTEAGWEIKISDSMTFSNQTLSVALYEQGSIDPVSDVVYFDTYNSCSENLVVVNFVQDK